ncbi:hypothetical protein UFOVP313_46 [uncultured Caudovirales phage]|uniref:Uncharacterized protein n=1 Tax=uncultured Caudovirales phage TaxID=2100421 RepID=A0A6J5LTB1_9CAUD|nr:hypothetical protein UFOVP313_46 [uncultured Caudovirales phage]
MALRFNGQSPTSVTGAFSAFPGRFRGTVSVLSQQTNIIPVWGARRVQTSVFGRLAGVPDGSTHPASFLMPLRSGRISSRSTLSSFSLSAAGTRGLPGVGSVSFSISVPAAELLLVVSGGGTCSFSFSPTGALAGALAAIGSTNISFSIGGVNIGAIVNLTGPGSFSFSGSSTPRALGALAGNISPFETLSPQSLAAAVWNALSADSNQAGSMGALVRNLPNEILDLTNGVESDRTVREALRLILAAVAGKVSGAGSSTITIRDSSDTKNRITASVDSQGNRTSIIYDDS